MSQLEAMSQLSYPSVMSLLTHPTACHQICFHPAFDLNIALLSAKPPTFSPMSLRQIKFPQCGTPCSPGS